MKFLPPYFIHLLLPPLALLLALGIAQTPLGKKMEYLTVDSRFQARAPHDPPAHPDLLLVGIGEQGIEHFGQWPWPRSIHGQLLQLLQLRPPTAITFDLIFSEPSQDSGHDDVFASGLEMHPGAITGTSAEDLGHLSADATADSVPGPFIGNTPALTRLTGDPSAIPGQDFALMPIPKLAETSLTGFVNVAPSAVDGYRRQVPLVIRVGSGEEAQVYPSLVLQTLMRKEHLGPQQVEIVLGSAITLHGEDHQWRIPIDESGRMTINYRGNLQEESNVFLHNEISYFGLTYFLLEHAAQHNAGEKTLWPKDYQPNPDDPSTRYPVPPVEDQFLLIGQTAAGLTDFGPTPLGKQTPLVRVHASALNNILQNDYLRTFPDWPIILGWLLLGWPLSLILRKKSIGVSILIPLAIIGIYGGTCFLSFAHSSLHMPLVWPVFGFVIAQTGSLIQRLTMEAQAKNRIKSIFSAYVAPEVVHQLVESGEDPKLGGEETEITAFFSDIQGFSTFSEQLSPTELVALMNEYLSEMSHILKYAGSGTLDKFIGDAMVGIFGAPYHYPDHAYRSCVTAIEMHRRQGELRDAWKASGQWPDLVHQMRTRIGLNTGLAIVGNMGSRDRMNYTMMGDTVNLAARCESGAKSYGVYTMVTGETKAAAEQAKDDMVFRFLDRIIVKGRSQPVEVYDLLGFQHDLPSQTRECVASFEQGIAHYLDQDWDQALIHFEHAAEHEPHQPNNQGLATNPSLVLAERCRRLKETPPSKDWDGVYVMTSK